MMLSRSSTSAQTPRRIVPVYARKGRNKVHWVGLYADKRPTTSGDLIPEGAGARSLCAPYQFAAGWTFLTYADVVDLPDGAFCRVCGA